MNINQGNNLYNIMKSNKISSGKPQKNNSKSNLYQEKFSMNLPDIETVIRAFSQMKDINNIGGINAYGWC